MPHSHETLADLLANLDLGSSVAEQDQLLEVARIETSAARDLYNDRVDLIPGTKGSGKSALFRIFVHFLPRALLEQRRVVVAHGVDDPGDPIFNAFRDEFERLDENAFVAFWCIYLISLAQEQFIKGPIYAEYLADATGEVEAFRSACASAKIPEIKAKKSLRDILAWTLNVLRTWRPTLTFKLPQDHGEIELDLGLPKPADTSGGSPGEREDELPRFLMDVRSTLEAVLKHVKLSLWLMVDRLDEIFPRRSRMERVALRGLLRAMRILSCNQIRVKVFLRDDMLEHVVRGENGFVALTHVTARAADTLRWTEEQVMSLVVKRIFANQALCDYCDVNKVRLDASAEYRRESFYKVFPPRVNRGAKQSPTLTWIYTRCADGRGVVTPRDVLDLLIRARQWQEDACRGNLAGTSDWMIGPQALQYGLAELSKRKRLTYLEAEFPHLWPEIAKMIGGKAEYSEAALGKTFGAGWRRILDDLVSVGVLASVTRRGQPAFIIPIVYRRGLEVTQGRA